MGTLEAIRSNKSRKVAKVLLSAFILVISAAFILTYNCTPVQGARDDQAGLVMTVNEQPFYVYQLNTYRNEYAAQLLGTAVQRLRPDDIAEILPDDVVLDQATTDLLLMSEAQQHGLGLSGDDVLGAQQQFILSQLSQQDLQTLSQQPNANEILNSIFVQIANQYGYNGSLMTQHIIDRTLRNRAAQVLIYPQARTSVLELWQAYEQNQTDYRLACAVFNIGDNLNVSAITSAEIQAHYNENPEQYTVGEKRIYEYVSVRRSALNAQVTVTAADVTAEFESNLGQYTTPAIYNLTLIRVDGDEGATERPDRLNELMDRIANGDNFADLVAEYSDDPTSNMGGQALRNADQLDPTVLEALSEISTGEVTEPLRFGDSWLVYRFNDLTPEVVPSLDLLKDQIRADLEEREASRIFDAIEEDFQSANESYTSLDDIAAALGQEIQTSNPTDPGATFIDGVGSLGVWADAVNDLEVGMIFDEVLHTATSLSILRLADVRPQALAPLDATLQIRIRRNLANQRAADIAEDSALTLRETVLTAPRVNSGEFFSASMGEMQIPTIFNEVVTVPFSPSNGQIPGVGNVPGLARKLHYSPVGSIGPVEEIRGENSTAIAGYVVWLVQERIAPDRQEFYANLLPQRAAVIQENQNRLLVEWSQDLRNDPDTEITRTDLLTR